MTTLILVELRLLLRSVEFLVVAIAFPAVFFLVMSEVFSGRRRVPSTWPRT